MAQDRPVIYLIDGSGYIFRAFFALPQLNNSRGLPTNAVYGFVRMMLKLLKDARPSHIAVVFDSPRKTFRDDLFEAYKANRKESPSDLNAQIPYIHRAVQAMRLPLLMLEGFEADDVIGTLAVRAARSGFDSVIVTADKDFMQIVGPHVTLWDTMRDRRMGAREVRERLGVDPAAVVDVMALMGDSIDNVKGVPGIGEKTATALIAHFGSLDKLFARLGTIEETGLRGAKKITALLTAHKADAELARKLVRIDTDAPVDAGNRPCGRNFTAARTRVPFDGRRTRARRRSDAAARIAAAKRARRGSRGGNYFRSGTCRAPYDPLLARGRRTPEARQR